MGCTHSSGTDNRVTRGIIGANGTVEPNDDPMTQAEIESRIDAIPETKTAAFGGIRVRYAYLSQRGYYPDEATKPNQDSYSVSHDFGGQVSDAFFAVYDGHGRDGDKCAQFARDSLPDLVAKYVSRSKSRESKLRRIQVSGKAAATALELTKEQTQTACLKAHVECNRAMHRSPHLDDSLSGTTSISVFVHGRRNRITVCNVGDSRAILGQRITRPSNGGDPMSTPDVATVGALRALPLSRDQTPYRRDERIRVRGTGARILSLDQIEGLEPIGPDYDEEADGGDGDLVLGEEIDEGGDPPRVWSPHGEYPGTAFTRSLGDSIAEELGVFAEPEMVTREITPDDKIIVLASDGVFEFLTNQSVIDICAKFSDPLEACRAVVAESYELWLQYELRTDDITMICIFIDEVDTKVKESFYALSQRKVMGLSDKQLSVSPMSETEEEDAVDPLVPVEGMKPVRQHLSKEKSKAIEQMKIKMASEMDLDEAMAMEEFDITQLYTDKSDEEKSRIAEAIRASVMFQNITDSQREMIFGVMEPIHVKKGDWVIRQGTVGDRFYVVDTGRFEVRILPEGETDPDGAGGNVVHVYEGSRENHAHPSFGELALMYSAPRAASIVAQTDGQIWALHRFAFKKILAEQTGRKELVHILSKVEVFKTFKSEDFQNLAANMVEVTFGRGEVIIKKGDVGDSFFVVCQGGQCERTPPSDDDDDAVAETLKAEDFFGEEVLAGGERTYLSSVVALSTTTCWKLDRATLKRTVGSLVSTRRRGSDNVA